MADYKSYFKRYKTLKVWLADKCLDKTRLIKQQLENKIPSVKAQVITDMPMQHGGDPSPVERFLIKSEEINYRLQQDIDMIQAEIDELTGEIQAIDARLAYLSAEERFILEQHFIEEHTWNMISNIHQCSFGKEVAVQPQSLIDIKNRALHKLESLENNNKSTIKQQFTRAL